MTTSTTISAKCKNSQTGKEWEGPIEDWEKHHVEIKHFCDGGDVECEVHCSNGTWNLVVDSRFSIGNKFRIKQREPKPGEVYYCKWTDVAILINEHLKCIGLHDGIYYGDVYSAAVYAAPSVKAYYAREILNDAKAISQSSGGCVNKIKADAVREAFKEMQAGTTTNMQHILMWASEYADTLERGDV